MKTCMKNVLSRIRPGAPEKNGARGKRAAAKRTAAAAMAALLIVAMCFGLSGCTSSDPENTINVFNWGEYIDPDLLDQFEEETGIRVNYTTVSTCEEMYAKIRSGGVSYDIVVPSDYMVSRMTEEGMLEEIDWDNVPNAQYIDEDFRNPEYDPEGRYSVPYQWGTVAIIYNKDMVDEEDLGGWDILWNKKYDGQILMFDNSRDAIGVALKYLGYSYNTTDEDQIREAAELLKKQKPLVQAYVMDQIFDKMEGGEAAMGVYYAGDFLSMKENNPDLAFAIPKEGANFFVDAMCVPKGARNKTEAEEWINFMCSYDASMANLDYIWYASPNPQVMKDYVAELDEETAAVLNPSKEELSRCQMFVNLPKETLELYDELWVLLKS